MSWDAINLRHVPDEPPQPPDYFNLVYRGSRHWFSGEPESLKTLVAYIILITAVRMGERVALIDFEMGQRGARNRLREMGVTDDEFDLIEFYEPDSAPTKEILQAIADHGCTLVVVDAAASAFDVSNLDENRDGEKFHRMWVTPLWKAGLTVIVLDHVVKNRENRGMYAIGSQRKVGASEVHIGFEAIPKLHRGGAGKAILTCKKDRNGFHRHGKGLAGTVEFVSQFAGHEISWAYTPPDGELESFRPTVLMARASAWLSEQTAPVSRSDAEAAVRHSGTKASNDALRQALTLLVAEGYATEAKGPHNAKLLTHARLFVDQFAGSPQFAVSSPGRAESLVRRSPSTYIGAANRRTDSEPLNGTPADDLQAEADRLAEKHSEVCRRCGVGFVRGTGNKGDLCPDCAKGEVGA